ncbi:MAG: glycosyltransferase family 2 protein [Pseudomonadota bacterium]|nr:glycosyltransferase family 2 protein [Pseudomonadota bacterium]
MNAPAISIVIPTLRRPQSLERALRSVLAQTDAADALGEILVVDNSPEGSARSVVAKLEGEAWAPLRYLHEPCPGVATARNAGVREASGELIAFIDDDQEAPNGWLAALLRTHLACRADVTFGPVQARIPAEGAWDREHLEALFSRTGPDRSGVIDEFHGCGNALLTRATTLTGATPFNTARDQGGGEDDDLFAELQAQGRRFAWAAEAAVIEHPAPHRLTLAYAARRAFAFGQGPTQTAAARREWAGVLRWMAIGAAQTAAFAPVAALAWALRRPDWPRWFDRTVRGVGKVLWISALEPRFYGQAEVRRSEPVLAGAAA